MSGQAREFLKASGMLQVLCYKEDIESALRTKGMGGFQLLGLSDFPGQGTALVGVLDAFWEEKGYVTPESFRRFCNCTVPLARLERRVYTTEDNFTADIEVSHFGQSPITGALVSWRLVGDGGRTYGMGRFPTLEIPIGAANPIGKVNVSLRGVPAPAHCKLVASIEGTPFENDWDIWVYPPAASVPVQPTRGVLVAHALDAATQAELEAGAAVVLMLPPQSIAPDRETGKVELGFSSIFWNTAWTKRQAPHTLGILCNPLQPGLALFPTEAYSNWQWWYPIRHAAAMILDNLPTDLQPIVQVVDDWTSNRKLALVFEARVGRGRLLVTSIDLDGPNLDPVRRQLRSSLLHYAASSTFNPTVEVSVEELAALTNSPTTTEQK